MEAPRSVMRHPLLFSLLHSTTPKPLGNSVLRLERKNKTKKASSSPPVLQLGCLYNTVQTNGMEWKSEVCWEPPGSLLSVDHQRCPFCWDASVMPEVGQPFCSVAVETTPGAWRSRKRAGPGLDAFSGTHIGPRLSAPGFLSCEEK